jgi:hypothetical protein
MAVRPAIIWRNIEMVSLRERSGTLCNREARVSPERSFIVRKRNGGGGSSQREIS